MAMFKRSVSTEGTSNRTSGKLKCLDGTIASSAKLLVETND